MTMRKNRARFAAGIAATCICVSACGSKENPTIVIPGASEGNTVTDAEVGKAIPAWDKGELDIHFINTTTGECIFIIMPDGTLMLLDAAGSQANTGKVGNTSNVGIRQRWDPTRNTSFRAGSFIADYIRKAMDWTGNDRIDYVLTSHFHNDHIGGASNMPVSDKSSTYKKASMAEILDIFPVGKLIDRAYPDYDYPFDLADESANAGNVRNYINAVKWHVANSGMKAERFKAGSVSQIVLQKVPGDYPAFEVRNLAVNGDIWTGAEENALSTFPAADRISVADPKDVQNGDNCPEENHLSAAVRISYGKFDFFSGGDLQYNGLSTFAWKDIETPVAKVCGEVEVMKADHHGTSNTNGYGFKNTCWAMRYLNPQCWVVNSWTDGHPRKDTFEGVTKLIPDLSVFITNTCDEQKAYSNYNRNVKGADGHIVVRVNEGGTSYNVYVLGDEDGRMTVKTISGPYTSR